MPVKTVTSASAASSSNRNVIDLAEERLLRRAVHHCPALRVTLALPVRHAAPANDARGPNPPSAPAALPARLAA